MLVGKPFDIGGKMPLLHTQMVNQPIARPLGQSVRQRCRAAGARHRPQRRQYARPLGARQMPHQCGRRQHRCIQRQMPRQRIAQAQQAVAAQLPVEGVPPANPLRPMARALLSTQPFDQALRRQQDRAQLIGAERGQQEMRGACRQQARHLCFLAPIEQHDQCPAARFHRGHQGRQQCVDVRTPAQIDKRNLRLAAQETLRRVAGAARGNAAPPDRLRRLRQTVTVAQRKDEKTMLCRRCGVPAH